MSRDIIINKALGIHIKTAHMLLSRLRSDILVAKGKRRESFVRCCFHRFCDIFFFLPLCFSLITGCICYLSNGAISYTTLCFIHFDVYLRHDGAIKENICRLSSRSTYPSPVTITVSNDTTFLSGCFFFIFCLFTCFLSFSHSLLLFSHNSLSF